MATWFLPKRVRPHFESIYAFSRTADDLGDEVARAMPRRQGCWAQWRGMLRECYERPAESMHPVFVALYDETIEQTNAATAALRQSDLLHLKWTRW